MAFGRWAAGSDARLGRAADGRPWSDLSRMVPIGRPPAETRTRRAAGDPAGALCRNTRPSYDRSERWRRGGLRRRADRPARKGTTVPHRSAWAPAAIVGERPSAARRDGCFHGRPGRADDFLSSSSSFDFSRSCLFCGSVAGRKPGPGDADGGTMRGRGAYGAYGAGASVTARGTRSARIARSNCLLTATDLRCYASGSCSGASAHAVTALMFAPPSRRSSRSLASASGPASDASWAWDAASAYKVRDQDQDRHTLVGRSR
jgi:hypothetical protein